jgi:hypothetical protein
MNLNKKIKYYFIRKEIDIDIYYYKKYVLLSFYDSINNNVVAEKLPNNDANSEKIINFIDKYFQKIKIDMIKNYKNKNNTLPEWVLDQYFQNDNIYHVKDNKDIDFTSKDIPLWVKNEYLESKKLFEDSR